jgi:hypothetical protein
MTRYSDAPASSRHDDDKDDFARYGMLMEARTGRAVYWYVGRKDFPSHGARMLQHH